MRTRKFLSETMERTTCMRAEMMDMSCAIVEPYLAETKSLPLLIRPRPAASARTADLEKQLPKQETKIGSLTCIAVTNICLTAIVAIFFLWFLFEQVIKI